MWKMWKMSVALSVAPLLIGSLFYGKCGKCEKYRWLPWSLSCSFAICFIENVENVKNFSGSFGGFLAHWLSVLWKMWKMWKMSVALSMAPLLIGSLFYGICGKCEKYRWLPRWLPCSLAISFKENGENVKNVGGSFGGSLAHWLSVLWEM